MRDIRQPARINVKALVILGVVAALLMGGAAVGYKVRKRIMANRALAAGKAALEKEDWAEACKHLRIYLSKQRDDATMLAQYAEANLSVRPPEAKYIRAALGAYRRLLRDKPGDDQICEKLARLYLRGRNFNEAAYICRQRLDAEPADPDAALMLGRALIAQRKHEEADEVLRGLVKEHPDQVAAYGLLSTLAMEEDSFSAADTAAQWLNQAVEENPESAEARAQRARFYRRDGNEVAAREDLEAADARQPEDPSVRLLLAGEWMSWGNLEKAQAELKAVEQVDAKLLDEFDLDPDRFALNRFGSAARLRLALLRSAAEESPELADQALLRSAAAKLADQALEELPERYRAPFLPVAVDLYLAGARVEEARNAVEQYREVQTPSEASALRTEQLAVLDAAVTGAEGKPYAAIELLGPVVVTNPEYAQAWRLLWRAYDRTGQRRRSWEALEAYVAVARRPGDPVATLALANAYQGRDWARVLRYAEQVEQARPDDLEPKLLRIKAILAGGAGKPTDTRVAELSAELATLRQDHPRRHGIYQLQALIAHMSGRLDDAAAVLEEAIEDCDKSLAAALQLALLHARNGQIDKALEVCQVAVKRLPGQAAPRIALAELQLAADRGPDARSTLAEAVEDLADEEKLRATYALALYMLSHDERPDAIELLKGLAAERTDDVRPRLELLRILEVRSNAQESQKLVKELKRIEGDTGLHWQVQQARLWLEGEGWRQHEQEIRDSLTRCIAADPGWSEPVLGLGYLYELLGQNNQAEEVYRRAVDSYPDQIDVASRLLRLLERQRRFADAGSILERMPPDLPALSAYRVDTAIGLGEYDSAIEELQPRIAADPDDAAGRVLLARVIYGYKKDADAAFNLLEEAESIAPDLFAVLRTRAEILHAEGRDEEALELLNAAVDRRNDFLAYFLRAQYYAATDRLDLAEKDYIHLTTLPESSANGLLLLGNFYYRDRKTAQAIAAWDAGLEAYPEHVGLQRLLIKALVISSEPQKRQRGRAMLDDVLQRLPDDPDLRDDVLKRSPDGPDLLDLLFVRAIVLLDEGKPKATQEATADLARVVQINPRHVAAHLQRIKLAHQRGDLDQAGEFLTQALGANPKNAELTLAHAMLEVQRNNLGVARELAKYVLEIDPKNVPARNLLAKLALRAGDTDSAQVLNNEVLERDPTNEIAHLVRAGILDARGMRDEAIEGLESYRRTDAGRDSVAPLLVLAELYRGQGDFAAAQERLAEAAQLAPDNTAVFLERLQWLAAQDQFDEIVAALADRRAEYPDEAAVLLLGGRILLSTGVNGHMREAKILFERAVAVDPDHVEAHLKLAQVAYLLGEVDVAEQAYRRILEPELEPYHWQALNDLAWILGVDQDKTDEALELADKGVDRYPDNPHLLDTRGVLLTNLDRLEDAQVDLEKCLKVSADLPATQARALLHLARVHVKQGEFTAAGQRLNEALVIDRQYDVLTGDERAEIEQLMNSSSRPANEGHDTP